VFRCAREQGPGLQIAAAGEGKKRGIAFAPSLFLNGKERERERDRERDRE
jgi:hypothetical protein